jgi:uncharacterized membrane protein YfcA
MGLSLYVVLGSAVVGLLVGLTGAGGGALMTPMLILLFSVKPAAAISSDLVAAVVMRPVGAAVHLHKGTVNLRMVGLMTSARCRWRSSARSCCGRWTAARLPAARRDRCAACWSARPPWCSATYSTGGRARRTDAIREVTLRPVPTVLIGMIGGLIVGITSVGAGSLMIILLLFTYPLLSAGQLVGTDLTQAVPLTAAAALGALTFGHVEFGVTASIIVGSVPAVLIGSLLSSRAPDRYIRPAITFVIFASGLKYVGVPTYPLGFVMGGILVAGAGYLLAVRRPWQRGLGEPEPVPVLAIRLRYWQNRIRSRRSGQIDRTVSPRTSGPGRRRLGRAAVTCLARCRGRCGRP